MDTKFSVAVHTLILIAESKVPLSSEEIAQSVGTNSSYIRKVLGPLKKEGIISSRQGVSGFSLEVNPQDLTLLQIYRALNQNPFFDIHQNPSNKCIVGRHIKSTLTNLLEDMESAINNELIKKTLNDCILKMKKELTTEELKQI